MMAGGQVEWLSEEGRKEGHKVKTTTVYPNCVRIGTSW